ncbi:hypothetical protein [Caulobacter sp. UNC279MFTsu5.1]|uniref:hypothetical protein n=1 Tax=Caulobacter sp. UNC279MFTsu5.1 TaxID=1502775 RepID=UPI000363CAC1|nr:hypothetical protein [Caulobacter sp. UNC279MFTsu5.1]
MATVELDETPAVRAVRLLGLIDIAHACRLTTDAVRKWQKSKGGLIPAQHQAGVLQLALDKGVQFDASDVVAFPARSHQ